MNLTDFSYSLPATAIAQSPLKQRDQSRLLVINRASQSLTDLHFYDLPSLLKPGDILVRNNTKVIPARLHGIKTTGGQVEIFLAKKVSHTTQTETWECLTKPGLKPGQVVTFQAESGHRAFLTARCVKADDYTRFIEFNQTGAEFLQSLASIGEAPLPPYITTHFPKDILDRYQTIFAEKTGSVAAPTAGLHFTQELDEQLLKAGIQIETVTLHVGLGTFLPVKVDDVTTHHMHSEYAELSAETATRLQAAKTNGQRIIAVGTTTVRVLESATDDSGAIHPINRETDIFIYPPYRFRFIDAMITNFHLPESTLLMLVSAFTTSPQTTERFSTFETSLIGRAYQKAIADGYRFYSFGDAMLIE